MCIIPRPRHDRIPSAVWTELAGVIRLNLSRESVRSNLPAKNTNPKLRREGNTTQPVDYLFIGSVIRGGQGAYLRCMSPESSLAVSVASQLPIPRMSDPSWLIDFTDHVLSQIMSLPAPFYPDQDSGYPQICEYIYPPDVR